VRHYLEKTLHKKGSQGGDPEFNPSIGKKKKKERKRCLLPFLVISLNRNDIEGPIPSLQFLFVAPIESPVMAT
jgi:hypothetical protein